ncbi:MAG TPA: hypothetical protein VIP57_07945 [Candidatus Dormibacteraeota bacterium]
MIMIGADTHKATHTCAAVAAATGQLTGELTVAARKPGFAELLAWGRGSMQSGSGQSRTVATSPERWSASWSPRGSGWCEFPRS